MDQWQRDHIRHNLAQLILHTKCDTLLLQLLLSTHVFSPSDLAALEALLDPHAKTAALYDRAQTRKDGYKKLIEALHAVGQDGNVEILLNGYRINNLPVPKLPGQTAAVPGATAPHNQRQPTASNDELMPPMDVVDSPPPRNLHEGRNIVLRAWEQRRE